MRQLRMSDIVQFARSELLGMYGLSAATRGIAIAANIRATSVFFIASSVPVY
jgi:hypothetical protein